MTEKTEYITASIELLEKRDELNSDELAVLCNLKKFMKNDHQPTFAVGEYYSYSDSNDSCIFKVTKISDPFYETSELSLGFKKLTKNKFNFDSNFARESKPATAEQIATFQRAEHFAIKGRELDEFRVGDTCKTVDGYMYTIGTDYIAKVSKDESATLIQTAEELQEVENSESV